MANVEAAGFTQDWNLTKGRSYMDPLSSQHGGLAGRKSVKRESVKSTSSRKYLVLGSHTNSRSLFSIGHIHPWSQMSKFWLVVGGGDFKFVISEEVV